VNESPLPYSQPFHQNILSEHIAIDEICLTITDKGKSFDVKRVLRTKGNKRLGLLGMREQLEMVGGKFSIKSTPGHGTTVTARIPATAGGGGKNRKRSLETKS
jgi:signal transduction histidine kinase